MSEIMDNGAQPSSNEFDIKFKSVSISGNKIELPSVGVTAIVGGNNVGKSTLLREIQSWHAYENYPSQNAPGRIIIDDLATEKKGDSSQLLRWLDQNTFMIDNPPFSYSRINTNMPIEQGQAKHLWGDDRLGHLTHFFVHYSTPISRAGSTDPFNQRGNFTDPPRNPLHVLQDNLDSKQKLSDTIYRILRKNLTLDTLSWQLVLRTGTIDCKVPPVDAVTQEYQDALAGLPTVPDQGDGMRSVIGLLLPLVTEHYPIILIDEPEAFLHPPQAHQLGMILGELSQEKQAQIILATHDKNILTGVLDSKAQLSVIRLERHGNNTNAHQLSADDIAELWKDPFLRYSNMLDALFHQVAIVCEADADCKFYAATIEAVNENSTLLIPPGEIMFVPAGGKDGIAKIVKALRAAKVNVVACADLDLLDDRSKVKNLVEAFDGEWQKFESNYQQTMRSLREEQDNKTCGEILEIIQRTLDNRKNAPWDMKVKKEIDQKIKVSKSRSRELKGSGLEAFKGESHACAIQLLKVLEELGICCVREGELERLAPEVNTRKGPGWLNDALKSGAYKGNLARKHALSILRTARIEPNEPTA